MLRVETVGGIVRITLTDWGIPLDADNVKPFDDRATVDTRANGGTGLHLIYSLMDDVLRKTASEPGGPNVLVLSKRVERRSES